MQYFILPIILIFSFNCFGQVLSKKMKLFKFKMHVFLGFSIFLGVYYVVCFPLVLMHANFRLVLLVSLLYFAIIFFYVLKNIKYVDFILDKKTLIITFVVMFFEFLFLKGKTVGSLIQYDTVNYTNLITSNIYLDGLNTFDLFNGYPGQNNGYALQSYYTLASVLYYMCNGIYNILGIDYFYFTQHTWMYSTILYFLLAEIIINFIQYFNLKDKKSYLVISLFLVLFMGNFYWNSEQAYLGNSFRMILVSYQLLYLKEYFDKGNINNLFIFGLINYANSACADSNATLAIIISFGVWIFLDSRDQKAFKMILFSVMFPFSNIIFHFGYDLLSLVSIFVFVVMIIFSEKINILLNKIHAKKFLPVLIFFSLIFMSAKITNNLFDISAFYDNKSGWCDMTWDYTDSSNLWRLTGNLCYLIFVAVSYFYNRKNKLFKMLLCIAIIFFNPFAAAIQKYEMVVFYRNYDICINYFIFFTALEVLESNETQIKKYANPIFVILIIFSFYSGINQYLYHPNISFEAPEDYNPILRMTNDEADVIRFLKDYVIRNDLDRDVKTISSILQVHTELPWLKTLYGRNRNFNNDSNYELYKIFYPVDYFGDPWAPKNPQYENMCEFISEDKYELIIQDKGIDYYDEDKNVYYSIRYLIDKCGSYPVYENNTYVVYRYFYE